MKYSFVGKILCVLCASMFFTLGRAEVKKGVDTKEADNIITRMDTRIAELDSLIFLIPATVGNPDFLQWSVDCPPDTAYAATVDAIVTEQIKTLKAQTGIQLTGQTYYRPFDAASINDEDDEVSRYAGKIQIEARWYFLQSGLLKKQGRIDELNLKADIDRLQHELGRTDADLYANREKLRLLSDSVLASILLHRVNNLMLLEDAYMYLLGNENISSDNLLRILDDRADAERKLSTMTTIPMPAVSLESVLTGTIQIDTAAVIASIENTDIRLQLLEMKEQLIDQKADNMTWWSDVRIAPFVRYSHYFRIERPASANVDMGLSFTIPINNETAHNRNALRAEKELLDYERVREISTATDKVRYLALETERLNRAIIGEWERAASLKRYLQIRHDAYAKRKGEYNRIGALLEYNSYLRCLESMIELQYKRDSLLAELQALIPSVALSNYCTFTYLNTK